MGSDVAGMRHNLQSEKPISCPTAPSRPLLASEKLFLTSKSFLGTSCLRESFSKWFNHVSGAMDKHRRLQSTGKLCPFLHFRFLNHHQLNNPDSISVVTFPTVSCSVNGQQRKAVPRHLQGHQAAADYRLPGVDVAKKAWHSQCWRASGCSRLRSKTSRNASWGVTECWDEQTYRDRAKSYLERLHFSKQKEKKKKSFL